MAKGDNYISSNEDEDDKKTVHDDDFDDDDEISKIRERRIQEMKERSKALHQLKNSNAEYTEVQENDFLKVVTGTANVVCHFYHNEFQRCKIVDKHLEILSKVHITTKFIKMNAEKAPFFVGKLNVRVLPTMVFFHNGVAVDRVVGFDDLGGKDDFKTDVLAKRIAQSGVLELKTSSNLTIISKHERLARDEQDD
ncbi:phosducin-like protein [Heterostelium album PN500]|uniref:Phosducin-like protein n=1 Tax=Heterostelium pallidum (strain ATCC 26659 / Pp 5 / PN500) TaxID=670386 RepID=D3BSQ1_HETP5|nr:phosducin-like protein [Heterostelium album PN500]EFA75516.1 phosducin-like protein [Heterostelium album PN500]|eukprot:XP_020427650.1 phosducin-like protein [Heterostelium album PN500]